MFIVENKNGKKTIDFFHFSKVAVKERLNPFTKNSQHPNPIEILI